MKKSDFMYEILNTIKKPEDIKNLNTAELDLLADEVRDFLINSYKLDRKLMPTSR